jgi:hypothetical protein
MPFMLVPCGLFLLLAINPSHRREWLVVACVTFLVWVNTEVFHHNDPRLYWNRAIVTFVGAGCLCWCRSRLGFYHATIYFLILSAYGALAFDISQGRHILIYNYYEAVVYGLVGCQLVGVLPTVRTAYNDFIHGSFAIFANLQRDKTAS